MISRRVAVAGLAATVVGASRPRAARAQGQMVLQTVSAWCKGTPLPVSTGQVATQADVEAIIAANLAAAPALGYSVDARNGSFTDPASGITIRQGGVAADPFFPAAPVRPFDGVPPAVTTKLPDSWGAGTAKIFIWGQSNASCEGAGRFGARRDAPALGYPNGQAWAFHGGQYYRLLDPIPGQDGLGGSWATRMADMIIGRPINATLVNRVVIANCGRGGTSINDWQIGGAAHSTVLIPALTAFMSVVGMPTHLLFQQGEADTGGMTATQWRDAWLSMLTGIRNAGCTSKIWTAVSTICNMRTASDYPNQSVLSRGPAWYVKKEIDRLSIRAGQALAGSHNMNTRPGPNTDLVDWRLRAMGDGCHMSGRGLDATAWLWANAILPAA